MATSSGTTTLMVSFCANTAQCAQACSSPTGQKLPPVAVHQSAEPTEQEAKWVPTASKGPSVAVRQRGFDEQVSAVASYRHLPELVHEDSSPAVNSHASVP